MSRRTVLRGLSVVEMLVAISVLSVGLVVELSVLPRGRASVLASGEYTAAAQLGQRLLEEWKAQPVGSLLGSEGTGIDTDGSIRPLVLVGGEDRSVRYTWRVQTSLEGQLVRIRAKVTWDGNTGSGVDNGKGAGHVDRECILETYVGRNS